MTPRNSGASLIVRLAAAGDADALTRFRCSTGPWYEQEVENFVRRRALQQALTLPEDHRLLLAFDGERLICCMAHHLELLLRGSGKPVLAARLQLLAIAVEAQGRRLHDGTRLSDIAMSTLVADAIESRNTEVLTAIVALDNLRSLALCRRHGLLSRSRYGARHVRLSGHFTRR